MLRGIFFFFIFSSIFNFKITYLFRIPCVYIVLINDSIRKPLQEVPIKTSIALQDLKNYANVTPLQLRLVFGEFKKLDRKVRSDIAGWC